MSRNEELKTNIHTPDCGGCIHSRVCSYINCMNDLCKAVSNTTVNSYDSTNGKVNICRLDYYNNLANIVISCKHYRKDDPLTKTIL